MAPAGGGGGGQPGRTGGGWGRGREPAAAAAQRSPPRPRRRRRRRSPWRAGPSPRAAPSARALRPPARGRARRPLGSAAAPGPPPPAEPPPAAAPPAMAAGGDRGPVRARPGAHTRGRVGARSELKRGWDTAQPPPPNLARPRRGWNPEPPGTCPLPPGWSYSTPAPAARLDRGPIRCVGHRDGPSGAWVGPSWTLSRNALREASSAGRAGLGR